MEPTPEWYASLEPASFRGMSFLVQLQSRIGGIRGPDHEYPGRDEGVPDELGNALQRFEFEAFVVGDDYHARAQDLVIALESGRGLLKHPRWGERMVVPRSWTVVESVDDQGLARFSLAFVEELAAAGEIWYDAYDTQVDEFAADLTTEVATEFDGNFDAELADGYLYTRFQADAAEALADVRSVLRSPLAAATFDPGDTLLALTGVVSTGTEFAATITDVVQAIQDRGVLLALARLRWPIKLADPSTPPDDPREEAVLRNRDAVSAILFRITLAELAVQLKDTEWETNDEATIARDELVELAEAEEATPIGREVYYALSGLKVALHRWISDYADDLANLRDHSVSRMTSTLELAWELYGDAERAQEIAERNGIVHGGFVAPGTLRVLSE